MDLPEWFGRKEPAQVDGGCPKCGNVISDEAESCPSCGGKLRELLAVVQMQAELNRIDLEWERERKKYMTSSEGERPSTPGSTASVVWCSLIWVVLSVIGVSYNIKVGDGDGLVCCAIFLVVGILVGLWGYASAADYEVAEAAYRRRRKEAELRYCAETKTKN